MGIKFKQGIIVVLIVFTTLTLLSCFKKRDTEDPSAPIVNTIRLEDGELFLPIIKPIKVNFLDKSPEIKNKYLPFF